MRTHFLWGNQVSITYSVPRGIHYHIKNEYACPCVVVYKKWLLYIHKKSYHRGDKILMNFLLNDDSIYALPC